MVTSGGSNSLYRTNYSSISFLFLIIWSVFIMKNAFHSLLKPMWYLEKSCFVQKPKKNIEFIIKEDKSSQLEPLILVLIYILERILTMNQWSQQLLIIFLFNNLIDLSLQLLIYTLSPSMLWKINQNQHIPTLLFAIFTWQMTLMVNQ